MSTSATGARARLNPPVGDHDHSTGPENAPVTLVEYGDFQCPYCGAAHLILREVQQTMGDRLRFVFRHFPLTQIHPFAESAAEASESAAAQGKFWQMHNLLFENQDLLDERNLAAFAEQLGLDTDQFARDLRNHTYHDRVRQDFSSGVRSGVNGTPAFFINGFRYDGSWELGPLLAALQEAADNGRE
ncbi:MAG TPA: DsbA family protein [Pyrinomonadaceae bacterium]|nr:DsbA family protein [Pyrinomonadaceae bacterium]